MEDIIDGINKDVPMPWLPGTIRLKYKECQSRTVELRTAIVNLRDSLSKAEDYLKAEYGKSAGLLEAIMALAPEEGIDEAQEHGDGAVPGNGADDDGAGTRSSESRL